MAPNMRKNYLNERKRARESKLSVATVDLVYAYLVLHLALSRKEKSFCKTLFRRLFNADGARFKIS